MNNSGCGIMFLLVILTFIAFFAFCYNLEYSNPHYETIVVKEKSIGVNNDGSYLVYTDHQVYSIQDRVFIGFCTSSDVYNQIEVGDTVTVKVVGKREPILSNYKNIVAIKYETKK